MTNKHRSLSHKNKPQNIFYEDMNVIYLMFSFTLPLSQKQLYNCAEMSFLRTVDIQNVTV